VQAAAPQIITTIFMITKNNHLYIKIGSLGWLNFFGIPTFLIGIGLTELSIYLIKGDGLKELSIFLVLSAIGTVLFIYQKKKLKFKSIDLNIPTDLFIENTRKLLLDEGWIIEYDNKEYLQAINRNGLFRLDCLTIKKYKHKIEYNLIHHPEDHNSIASLIDYNLKGKRTLKKIIAST
jgi:hypothetical protein